jgi:1,4-dihydroxy-2-naphthoate octaprenyltransferase
MPLPCVKKQPGFVAFIFAVADKQFTGGMDSVSVTAVIISGILVFTAIHAQDFPDVEGDKTVGRMTFPIYAPELSRFLMLFVTVAWSIFLSWFWKVGPISTALFTSFGIHVGLRCYCWRTLEADRKSYLIFNVRILTPLTPFGMPKNVDSYLWSS